MYSKDQILTMYLNQSPYGGRRNGVESAAQTYFGKHVSELSLAECALLAAIPNNPGVFNPYNEAGHEQLIWRQHYTLDVMAEMGYITKDEYENLIDYLWKPYEGLNGNGSAARVVEECKRLPIKEHKED